MRISDWSSDVCSSDLIAAAIRPAPDSVPVAGSTMRVGPSRGSESVIWSRKACTARVTLLRAATIAGVSAGWAGSVNATRSARLDALDASDDPTSDTARQTPVPPTQPDWAPVAAAAPYGVG